MLDLYSAKVMERQQDKPTQLNDEGKLIRPKKGFKSLIRFVLRKPLDEKTAVKMIWGIGIITAVIMPWVLENQTLAQFLQIKEFFYQLG